MAMSDSYLQMMLAADPDFIRRLTYIMVQTARGVIDEPPETSSHAERARYASQVLQNPQGMTGQASILIVGGPNLIGKTTLEDEGPVTSATDAEIFSQVATYWNNLSGVKS